MDLEVAQGLRRYVASGQLDARRGSLALDHLAELDLARYPHQPLMPRIWSLRQNLTAYDSAYVALAEALGATLLTRDRRLAGAPQIATAVEVV